MGVSCAAPAVEDHQTLPLDVIRQHTQEELDVRQFFYGDFYSLAGPSLNRTDWVAWQFDRPDLGQGIVQAFRREDNEQETASFKLHGLDPTARYAVTDADSGQATQAKGRELMEQGLPVRAAQRPAALLLRYDKIS